LVSIDGGVESYRRIADPESTFMATVAVPFEEMGRMAVDAVDKIVVGKQPVKSVASGPYLFVDSVLVDQTNVAKFLKP
jgi:simple sugar transport system substrate-binding protein/ribose transport system substrate-binding protein